MERLRQLSPPARAERPPSVSGRRSRVDASTAINSSYKTRSHNPEPDELRLSTTLHSVRILTTPNRREELGGLCWYNKTLKLGFGFTVLHAFLDPGDTGYHNTDHALF